MNIKRSTIVSRSTFSQSRVGRGFSASLGRVLQFRLVRGRLSVQALPKDRALGDASPVGFRGLIVTTTEFSHSPPHARSLPLPQLQPSLIQFADPCPTPTPIPTPQTVSLQELQQDFENTTPTDPNNNQTSANGASVSYITFSPDSSPAAPCEPSASAETPSEPSDMLASVPPFVTFHTIILDMSGVSFVDLMGIKALGKVRAQAEGVPARPPPQHPHPCSPTLPFLGALIWTS